MKPKLTHREAVNSLLETFPLFYKGRLFKRNVGLFRLADGRVIRIGEKGQSDLTGWITFKDVPIHTEIEVKVGRDKLSADQIAWQKVCASDRVIHAVFQDGDIEKLKLDIEAQRRRIYG